MDKPIAWYDPSNGVVSTDQDCPLFTPLGQVWGLYLKEEAKNEPVAWVYPEFWQHLENLNCGTAYRLSGIGRQPLYTTPPQRTWVGLTADEYAELAEEYGPFPINQIEAKLKEKNT